MVVQPQESTTESRAKRGKAKKKGVSTRGAADLAALRLILTGESAVDLPRLWFNDRDSVDLFIRLNGFDTDNPLDMAQLGELHQRAYEYLTDHHNIELPREVEQPSEVHDLFLMASFGERRVRQSACVLLKTMHILHHIHGRELIFRTAISEAQLFERLNARVFVAMDGLRAAGVEVEEFASGKKSLDSMISKLLSKRSNLASHIFDRLRFRLTVASEEDIVRALLYFSRTLFPFNYVVPKQSQNDIVTQDLVAKSLGVSEEMVKRFWSQRRDDDEFSEPLIYNEFSGSTYRTVNFVVDIPVRLDDVTEEPGPAIAFVQTEIQLCDSKTARANNQGENAHEAYKARQMQRVRKRLKGPRWE